MATELKGRFANYYTGNKTTGAVERKVRLSLNAIKVNFGADIAKELVANKQFIMGNTHWFELELLPGERNANEIAREKMKVEICKALYLDLRESFTGLTYAWLLEEANRLIAGGLPSGSPSMFLQNYLVKTEILEEKTAINKEARE